MGKDYPWKPRKLVPHEQWLDSTIYAYASRFANCSFFLLHVSHIIILVLYMYKKLESISEAKKWKIWTKAKDHNSAEQSIKVTFLETCTWSEILQTKGWLQVNYWSYKLFQYVTILYQSKHMLLLFHIKTISDCSYNI